MLEATVVLFRWAQFAGAMILFGSSLFLIYALPRPGAGGDAQMGWIRRLLGWSAAAVLTASLVGLAAQTSILAGSISEGLKPASVVAVITTMSIGPSALIRAGASALALFALAVMPVGRRLYGICTVLGAVVTASFAWMGHGAAMAGSAGLVHLLADILHALAAGVWIGALVIFFGLLRRPSDDAARDRMLHRALHGFAGVGSALVAVLVATGFVNSWFLVGPSRLSGLWTTPYGQLLSLKLLLFVGMLGLAAGNRFRLTPALGAALDGGHPQHRAIGALRRSLMVETAVSFAVLALIAWFGTLAPVAAQ